MFHFTDPLLGLYPILPVPFLILLVTNDRSENCITQCFKRFHEIFIFHEILITAGQRTNSFERIFGSWNAYPIYSCQSSGVH
jgi:hypothetical protein